MFRTLIVAVALLLTGCDTRPTAQDGYRFEQDSERRYPSNIRVVVEPSVDSLNATYAKLPDAPKLSSEERLFGFSRLTETGCTIYIVDPKVEYRPEEFGHELTHCIYGSFHDQQDAERRGS